MKLPCLSFALLSAWAASTNAEFLGPRFPAPRDFSSDKSLVSAGWKNVVSLIEASLNSQNKADPLASLQQFTFSLGAFSLQDPAAADLQFHHVSPEVLEGKIGTKVADGDTIYPVASITKVFTVFAGLLEFQDGEWDRPLTDFVPALRDYIKQKGSGKDLVNQIQWDQVTLRALSAHAAGVSRDSIPFHVGDYAMQVVIAEAAGQKIPDPTELGLRPLNLTDPSIWPACIVTEDGCTDGDYAAFVSSDRPMYLPWSSSSYANNGFILLGMALVEIAGTYIEDIYKGHILTPLGMASTGTLPPKESDISRSVIIDSLTSSGFDVVSNITLPSGGVYSTTNDLARFGLGILNSTLLPTDETRLWMKPVTHTASLTYSSGRPWEILRYVHPKSGLVTDMYTKAGDSGFYSSNLILLPQYDAGFSILMGGSARGRYDAVALLADLITENVIPALEAQASAEAATNLAGKYVSVDTDLKSELVLAVSESATGAMDLVVSSWISNGTDMLANAAKFGYSTKGLRLLQAIPESGSGQVAFRATQFAPTKEEKAASGLFSGQMIDDYDWFVVGAGTYGRKGYGHFIFDVDDDGKATGVLPVVTENKLNKAS